MMNALAPLSAKSPLPKWRPAFKFDLKEGTRVIYKSGFGRGPVIDGTITGGPVLDDAGVEPVWDVKLDHGAGERWGYLDQFFIEEQPADTTGDVLRELCDECDNLRFMRGLLANRRRGRTEGAVLLQRIIMGLLDGYEFEIFAQSEARLKELMAAYLIEFPYARYETRFWGIEFEPESYGYVVGGQRLDEDHAHAPKARVAA